MKEDRHQQLPYDVLIIELLNQSKFWILRHCDFKADQLLEVIHDPAQMDDSLLSPCRAHGASKQSLASRNGANGKDSRSYNADSLPEIRSLNEALSFGDDETAAELDNSK